METKGLVGKWIESEVLADDLCMPADTAFKVVGIALDVNWAIVDAGLKGWKWMEPGNLVIEKCETYMYVHPDSITKVL